MIKLTLNPESESTVEEFSSFPISIASSSEGDASLLLPQSAPDGIRLEITEVDGQCRLTNHGANPIATLNGIDLGGEGEIQNGDRIHIDELVILFEVGTEIEQAPSPSEEELAVTEEELDSLLSDVNALEDEEKVELPSLGEKLPATSTGQSKEDLELEKELEEILSGGELDFSEDVTHEELSEEDLDALVREAENISTETGAPPKQEVAEEETFEFAADDLDVATEEAPEEDREEEPPEEIAEEPEPESPQDELILDFQEGPVDQELDQIIAENRETEKTSSLTTEILDDSATTSQSSWSHIERDIIDTDDLSKEDARSQELENFLTLDPFEEEPRSIKKMLLIAMVVILALGSVTGFLIVSYLEEQNRGDELVAARGVADVAMALTHALIETGQRSQYQISNPEYIEKHLNDVLSPMYRKLSTASSQQGFVGNRYRLRIYSQDDPVRFLLVADPVDDWSHWLAHRKGFVLESKEMVVRESSNPELWDELLGEHGQLAMVDPDQFDRALKTSTPMRLTRLNANSIVAGFSVPKDLPYVLPNAETIIYNASRYHAFTDAVVAAISRYDDDVTSERDRAVLRHQLSQLAQIPQLVLYGSAAMQQTEKAQKILEDTLPPGYHFLMGHVTLNKEKGTVIRSDLLLDEAAFAVLEGKESFNLINQEPVKDEETLNTSHPLFITLMELSRQRQVALQEVGVKITSLLNDHNKKEEPNFVEKYEELFSKYRLLSLEYKDKISRILYNLYEDYVQNTSDKNMPLFLASVKATELEYLLPDQLQEKVNSHHQKTPLFEAPKDFEEALEKIQASANLKELGEHIDQIDSWLDGQSLKKEDLTKKQGQIKTIILKRLGGLLLSPDSTLTRQSFQERNRLLLAHILNVAKVSEEEERAFYLGEFDHLMERFRAASSETGAEVKQLQKEISEAEQGDYRGDPDFQREMEGVIQNTEVRLSKKRAEIVTLKDQLAKVPLRTATTSPEEQQANYGRLGQQILIQESLQPPGNERDLKLHEAIGLLAQSTQDNRALWADILEARRLLTDSPRDDILKIVQSDLGFSPTRYPLSTNVRKAFKQYIEAKKALTKARSDEQYEAQFVLLKKTHRRTLESIIGDTRRIQERSTQLLTRFDDFIQAVDEFSVDYKTARDEGFLTSNQRYHSNMIYQLDRKSATIQTLKARIVKASNALLDASRQHEQLAHAELAALESSEKVTRETVSQLQQQHNRVHYPNIIADNLKIKKTLDLGVYPIPQ